MNWQLKFLGNAVFGVFPLSFQTQLRKIKRSIIPYEIQLNTLTLSQGLQQVEMLKASGFDLTGKSYLELGTGWSPVIPLVFSLAGCRSLTLVDSQRLMDDHTFAETCKKMLAHTAEIATRLNIAEITIAQRLSKLASMRLVDALAAMNCAYLAPEDLLNLDIQAHSIDIITSRAVLEHIPPLIIKNILTTFNQLLSPTGAMCHIIDNSDHWEFNDKSITRVNFLKFSQKTFDFLSAMNPLDYQNRLRHSQYIQMFIDAGFKVTRDDSQPDPTTRTALDSLLVHPSFNHYSKADLAILTSYLVAEK
ncbi:MAG: methyltransferase domain-containing protein [Methylococcaceae bacterium]|nr:methyltransferase domain-containing protein [Methylococcaceae bacterium]